MSYAVVDAFDSADPADYTAGLSAIREPSFCLICDFDECQHDRHLCQYADRRRKCRRACSSEQGNRDRDHQLKEVGCADHAGRRCDFKRQPDESPRSIGKEENHKCLDDERHRDQHDVKRIAKNDFCL